MGAVPGAVAGVLVFMGGARGWGGTGGELDELGTVENIGLDQIPSSCEDKSSVRPQA